VSSASLAQLVTELRRALGDPARSPRYIRTVHGYGYAFCGAIAGEETASSAWLVCWKGREVALPPGESFIGRARDVIVRIDSLEVSRHHARLRVSESEATIEDLGSKNGTFVRGRRIDEVTALAEGDEVRVGPAVLLISRASTASTRTTPLSRRPPRGGR
jgi:hypothetical protein